MSVLIGIISYLPENITVRTQRLKAVTKQFEWLNKSLCGIKTFAVLQNYKDISQRYNEEVRYEKPIGAGAARNVVLKKFYDSDFDWLLLLDDDTIIDTKYEPVAFMQDVFQNPDKFSGIDGISAVEPEYHPYKKLNFEDKGNLTHYKFEPRELNSGSATSIIRNIKKYYGKELYYPNTDAMKGEGREDVEFLIEWLLAGFTWYTMDTWIRKSLCFDKSSIFGLDTKQRDKILMHDLDVVCDKYKAYGLMRGVNGRITWSAFNSRYNKSEKVLYIKRNKPIEFTEDTMPKIKTPSASKLF